MSRFRCVILRMFKYIVFARRKGIRIFAKVFASDSNFSWQLFRISIQRISKRLFSPGKRERIRLACKGGYISYANFSSRDNDEKIDFTSTVTCPLVDVEVGIAILELKWSVEVSERRKNREIGPGVESTRSRERSTNAYCLRFAHPDDLSFLLCYAVVYTLSLSLSFFTRRVYSLKLYLSVANLEIIFDWLLIGLPLLIN